MKILIIEDDERISSATAEILKDNHYLVETAFDGQIGWELAQTMNYDLIILDLMLPKIDGITLCQKLRKIHCQSLILMLTAKDTNLDQVTGLDAGADDYVVKPFDLKLLLARIRALLRRNQSNFPPILTWENISFDPSKCEVKYNNKLVDLTPKEYHLLELFLRSGDRILTKGMIMERLWLLEDIPLEETVKVHIKGLRNKLKLAGGNPNLIENIYGLGYRLNPNF